jgi:hypothetical protein
VTSAHILALMLTDWLRALLAPAQAAECPEDIRERVAALWAQWEAEAVVMSEYLTTETAEYLFSAERDAP